MDALQPPTKKLYGLDQIPLEVVGETTVRLAYQDKQCTQATFILQKMKHNLLPAIWALHVLTQVDIVSKPITDHTPIPDQYPSLFTGLGILKGDSYVIQFKPDAKPFALYTPRNVPTPLRKKVQDELSRMQSLGVISPVEEPTQWCAGMVMVPKPSGVLRIYCQLNSSVLREVHPLPKVDVTLAQLAGATAFSKLDANSGFWQIPLSEDSCSLTTFITPFGRYAFNKLPFWMSSALDHFQRRMSQILAGQDGALCHMDGVLVFV